MLLQLLGVILTAVIFSNPNKKLHWRITSKDNSYALFLYYLENWPFVLVWLI